MFWDFQIPTKNLAKVYIFCPQGNSLYTPAKTSFILISQLKWENEIKFGKQLIEIFPWYLQVHERSISTEKLFCHFPLSLSRFESSQRRHKRWKLLICLRTKDKLFEWQWEINGNREECFLFFSHPRYFQNKLSYSILFHAKVSAMCTCKIQDERRENLFASCQEVFFSLPLFIVVLKVFFRARKTSKIKINFEGKEAFKNTKCNF